MLTHSGLVSFVVANKMSFLPLAVLFVQSRQMKLFFLSCLQAHQDEDGYQYLHL